MVFFYGLMEKHINCRRKTHSKRVKKGFCLIFDFRSCAKATVIVLLFIKSTCKINALAQHIYVYCTDALNP